MSKPSWIFILSFLLAAGGFLLPLWPLSVIGVLLAAGTGRWISAVLIGLLLDVAWGAPGGMAQFLYFPFTLLAVVGALGYALIKRSLFEKSPELPR